MRRYFFYLLIILALYYPALHLGFSQDDFFFLRLSTVHNLGDFLRFFLPSGQGSFPFYRPLGTQVFFSLFHSAFPMHIFMLMVHALSVTQIFKLFVNLGFDKRKSNLVAIVYLFASLHFLSLVYIAAGQHLLATAFSLLSLNAFFAASPILAGMYFLFALLSKESAIVLPAVAGLLYLYKEKKFPTLIAMFRKSLPFLLIGVSYLLFRFFSGVTIQSEYSYIFDGRILTTLRFYVLFLLGYMESVQDYAIPSMLKQYLFDTNPWGYLTLIGSSLAVAMLALAVLTRKLNIKNLLYGLSIFVIGLSLYLGLPAHIFPHYLDYSLIGFLLILAGLNSRGSLKLITLALVIAGIGGIYSSFRLHWSPTRSRLNSTYIPYLVRNGLCDSSIVILTGDPVVVRNLSYSLSGSNAGSVICGKDMDVYFLPSEALEKEGTWNTIPVGAKVIEVKSL